MHDEAPSLSRAEQLGRWVPRVGASVIVAIVGVIYLTALSHGRWPPGHPFSGASLLLGAAVLAGLSFGRGLRAAMLPVVLVAAILSTLSSLTLLASTYLAG